MIEKQIRETVDSHIQQYIKKTIEDLVLNPSWVERVETTINLEFARKFSEKISGINIDSLVNQHLDSALDRWKQKLINDFRTRGFHDQADELELTILPGAVVIENDLISKKLQVHGDAEIKGRTCLKDLSITGTINTDNPSWNELKDSVTGRALEKINEQWRQDMAQQVLDLARVQGIDFDKITIRGMPLIEGEHLNPTVTKTNIKQLGTLDSLTVDGKASLNDTINILKNRVGINTEIPEMALSVWDEEVSVAIGKFKQQQAYIGTTRLQKLSIGVNRQSHIEIDTDGLVKVNSLKVNQWRIDFDNKVPGHSGARGDIIFNTDPKPGTPFAWQCLGGFQWQAIRNNQ